MINFDLDELKQRIRPEDFEPDAALVRGRRAAILQAARQRKAMKSAMGRPKAQTFPISLASNEKLHGGPA